MEIRSKIESILDEKADLISELFISDDIYRVKKDILELRTSLVEIMDLIPAFMVKSEEDAIDLMKSKEMIEYVDLILQELLNNPSSIKKSALGFAWRNRKQV